MKNHVKECHEDDEEDETPVSLVVGKIDFTALFIPIQVSLAIRGGYVPRKICIRQFPKMLF
jgi:hypothetical protein